MQRAIWRPAGALRAMRVLAVLFALSVAGVPAATAGAGGDPAGLSQGARVLGRQVLPAKDGWAAEGAGTTGGSAADAGHTFVVHNRAELVAALGGGGNATPKLIYIAGTIEGNVDDANQPLSCADLADPAYSLEAYLAAYDPAVWGGAIRAARWRRPGSARRPTRPQVRSTSARTPPSSGCEAPDLTGTHPDVDRVNNVIIRNLTFEDPPTASPSGPRPTATTGNWNSQYDNISVAARTHVWVDHNTFTDGDNPDSEPAGLLRPAVPGARRAARHHRRRELVTAS